LEQFKNKSPTLENFDANQLGIIEFIQADFTKTNISDANVVYIASTCFDDNFMSKLALSLEQQLATGTKVITLTRKLPSAKFILVKSQQ
ncbi:hypothetical protein MEO41_29110, partial [Dolichospermum sp. ST_sed4]|nr:hypothetical protein [Dolichospermum sp. ST_sed4]